MLPVQQYIHTESVGGLVLLIATAVAVGWANSPWSEQYHHILEQHLTLNVVLFKVELAIEEWINDGLMAIFFFVVALEIKRELLFGQLSTPRRAALPVVAAFGGMVVPAVLYLSLNAGGEAIRGVGHPNGDRHRVRAGSAGAAGAARTAGAEGLTTWTRGGGRPGRDTGNRGRL